MKGPKILLKKIGHYTYHQYARFCNVPLENLIALLVVCQILDFILTYLGVSQFGISREGNPLLRSLMYQYNPVSVLFVVKCLAIMLLYFIRDAYGKSKKDLQFIIPCLHVILIVYTVGAIIPWTIVLLLKI